MNSTDQQLVYLSLGSNISPRRRYISEGFERLEKYLPRQFGCSSMYQTEPFHNLEQSSYINAVACGFCDLAPLELLTVIGEIETSMGRFRSGEKWESRTIDIDILLWGSDIIRIPRLSVPHYDLSNRDFFLVPLLELNSSLVHPETGMPLQQQLALIPDRLRTYPEKTGLSDSNQTRKTDE